MLRVANVNDFITDDNCLKQICFEYPGAPTPILVFPISVLTTSLREIAIPSNAPTGIADAHLQKKGFALVNSANNTELFCVATDSDEYVMWVSEISEQLKQTSKTFDIVPEKDQIQPVSIPESDQANSLFINGIVAPSFDNNAPAEDKQSTVDASSIASEDAQSKMSTISPAVTEGEENIDEMDAESVDMETISLSRSDEKDHDGKSSTICIEIPGTEKEKQSRVGPRVAMKAAPTLSTRDLLSKSRISASKFNSAFSKAKEKGRDGLRQALEVSESQSSMPTKSDVGQRLNGLKQNANVKISKLSNAVRTTVQEHTQVTVREDRHVEHISFSGLETLGSESQVLELPNNSVHNRQEQIRGRLTNLDQSMIKRLKIDEKLNTIGNAMRNAANEGQVVARQISNTGSVSQLKSSAQRQPKSNKFDARETFTSHSYQPVRVKSIKSSTPLIITDEYLSEKGRSLSKIRGTWIIKVEMEAIDSEHKMYEQKLKITSTEIDARSAKTVTKSLSEVCFFYTLISEMLSSYLDCAAVVTHKDAIMEESIDPILYKLSPLERIQMSGYILQGVLDATKPTINDSTISQSQCELLSI